MKRIFLLVLLFNTLILAQNIRVMLMGVVPGGAPDFEKKFEELLRQEITVIPEVDIADYNDTEYLKRKTDFFDSPVISRSMVQSLRSIPQQRLLVVWGEIDEFTIKPIRYMLIGAKAVGTLRFTLTMYSLSFKEYCYLGEIESVTSIAKPLVFFRNVEKITHISASDRTVIIKELSKQTVERSVDIVNSVVRNLLVKEGISPSSSSDVIKSKKNPSVSDLFDIPSVVAPDVTKDKIKGQKDKDEPSKPDEKPKKKKKDK